MSVGRYPDYPIVVVSAGPSLDENIESLRSLEGRGVIISSGKALQPLIEGGIEPQLIVITDPQAGTYKQMERFLDLKIPFVFIPSTCPQIVREYGGPMIIALIESEFRHPELSDLVEEKGEVDGGGSVATTCLDIAIRMGGNPIILVGQDLSFPQDRVYSSGIHAMEDWLNGLNKFHTLEMSLRDYIEKGEDVYVKGVSGGMVRSKRNLLTYLRWIERRIRREPERIFINTSRFGARIVGTEEIGLSSAIDRFCQKSIPVFSPLSSPEEGLRFGRWKEIILKIMEDGRL